MADDASGTYPATRFCGRPDRKAGTGKEFLMLIRSLLLKGAAAGVLAAGSLGLAAGAAHADGGSCAQFARNATYWNNQAWTAWNNYMDASEDAGGQPAADFYYETYQDDISTYHYWDSRYNACNREAP